MGAKQVLLCGSEEQRGRAEALFPTLEVRYLNGQGWESLAGKRVVTLGELLAHFAVGHAESVKVLPEELPDGDLSPEAAMAWARKNAVPYHQAGASVVRGHGDEAKDSVLAPSSTPEAAATLPASVAVAHPSDAPPEPPAAEPSGNFRDVSNQAGSFHDSQQVEFGGDLLGMKQTAGSTAKSGSNLDADHGTVFKSNNIEVARRANGPENHIPSLEKVSANHELVKGPHRSGGEAIPSGVKFKVPGSSSLSSTAAATKLGLEKTGLEQIGADRALNGLEVSHNKAIIASSTWEQSLDGWPDPVDFWGNSLAHMPTVSVDMLPPWLLDYVLDQSSLRGVDPVQATLQCVVALSGALHNSHGVRPKAGEPDYVERPVLWGATVGHPSSKKDAGQAIALAPLQPIDTEMRIATAKRQQERSDSDALYQDELVAWRKAKQVGPRPVAPEPIQADRILVDNFTLEGLRGVLEHNSRGKCLVATSELAGVFGNADAFTNNKGASKDLPMLLRLYESKAMIVDRAAPAPPVFVKSWAASIAGAIQPSILSRIVSKLHLTEDGMLPRFLLVMSGNGNAGEDRVYDRAAKDNYYRVVRMCVGLHAGEQPCNLSPEATEIRKSFLQWVYRSAGSGTHTDGLAAAVGKFEGSFARLCLVLHAAQCAQEGLPVIAPEIPDTVALRAQALILGLFYPHAARFYRDITPDSGFTKSPMLIAGMILATGMTELSSTALWHKLSSWRQTDTRSRHDAIAALIEAGWLRERSKTRWTVNPAVFAQFAGQAEYERERRARYAAILEEKIGRSREPGTDD